MTQIVPEGERSSPDPFDVSQSCPGTKIVIGGGYRVHPNQPVSGDTSTFRPDVVWSSFPSSDAQWTWTLKPKYYGMMSISFLPKLTLYVICAQRP